MDRTYHEYSRALLDLKDGTKAQINFLTILADDNAKFAPAVVRAIEGRIRETKGRNIHYLYLIDSILKNVKDSAYKGSFQNNLVDTFMGVFVPGSERARKSAVHVLDTWGGSNTRPAVFPPQALASLNAALRDFQQGRAPSSPRRNNPAPPAHAGPRPGLGPGPGPRGATHEQRVTKAQRLTSTGYPSNRPALSAPSSRQEQERALFEATERLRVGGLSRQQYHELTGLVEHLKQQLSRHGPYAPQQGMGSPRHSGRPPQVREDPRRRAAPQTAPYQPYQQPVQRGYPSGPPPGQHQMPPGGPRRMPPAQQQAPGRRAPSKQAVDLLAHLKQAGFNLDALKSTVTSVKAQAQPRQPTPRRKRRPSLAFTQLSFKDIQSSSVDHEVFVNALYGDQPIRCHTCAVRFPDSDKLQYQEHLDWHFRQNNSTKNSSSQFRGWFLTSKEWVMYTGVEDVEERSKSSVFDTGGTAVAQEPMETATEDCFVLRSEAPAESCAVCQDKFESAFEDDLEEWVYRDAKIVNGQIFHPRCYQDAAQNETLPSACPSTDLSNEMTSHNTEQAVMADQPVVAPMELIQGETKRKASESEPGGPDERHEKRSRLI